MVMIKKKRSSVTIHCAALHDATVVIFRMQLTFKNLVNGP